MKRFVRLSFAAALIFLISSSSAPVLGEARNRFPLRVSQDGRRFENQQGKPFFILGDAAWSLIAQLNIKEAEYYLEQRKAQGFNAILVNLIEHKFSKAPPKNASGDEPFIKPNDFSIPNEKYFEHADAVIRLAAERGILVFLVPAYLGAHGGDEGWFQQIKKNGRQKLREYGRYVGNRYKNSTNVIWVVGGDYTPSSSDSWTVDELALGIRETGATQPMTAHCSQGDSNAGPFSDRAWLNFGNIYSYSVNLYSVLINGYQRKPIQPFVHIEGKYEGEHNCTREEIRRQAYWALLAGAAGHFYGNNPVWNFDSPVKVFPSSESWKGALKSAGAEDMINFNKIVRSKKWNELVPDLNHRFLAGENGDRAARDSAVSASTQDGRDVIIYMSGAEQRRLTIKLPGTSREYVASWIDPSSGKANQQAKITIGPGRRAEVSVPSQNGLSGNDWLLVLKRREN